MIDIVIKKIVYIRPDGKNVVVGNFCHTLNRYLTVGETLRTYFTEVPPMPWADAEDEADRYDDAKAVIVPALEFFLDYTREEATLIFEAAYRFIAAEAGLEMAAEDLRNMRLVWTD